MPFLWWLHGVQGHAKWHDRRSVLTWRDLSWKFSKYRTSTATDRHTHTHRHSVLHCFKVMLFTQTHTVHYRENEKTQTRQASYVQGSWMKTCTLYSENRIDKQAHTHAHTHVHDTRAGGPWTEVERNKSRLDKTLKLTQEARNSVVHCSPQLQVALYCVCAVFVRVWTLNNSFRLRRAIESQLPTAQCHDLRIRITPLASRNKWEGKVEKGETVLQNCAKAKIRLW